MYAYDEYSSICGLYFSVWHNFVYQGFAERKAVENTCPSFFHNSFSFIAWAGLVKKFVDSFNVCDMLL